MRWAIPSSFVLASLMLALTIAAPAYPTEAVAARGDGASGVIAATASVAPPALPARKTALRELRYALGDDVARVARVALSHALADRRVFTAVVERGGDYVLEADLEGAKHEFIDFGVQRQTPSPLSVSLEATCRWTRGGQVVHQAQPAVRKESKLSHVPWKGDLTALWTAALQDLADRCYEDAYTAGAFGAPPSGPWIDKESAAVPPPGVR